MMTPAMLERASPAFRRGYNDQFHGRNNADDYREGTFARHDYEAGQQARANEYTA